MKVVAFNGSPHEEGNTAAMIRTVLAELEAEGIDTEVIQVGGSGICPCTACEACFESGDGHCVLEDDKVNDWFCKMREANGIILGSPTWFGDITPEMKSLIDRTGMLAMSSGGALERKAGAAVSSVSRSGALHSLASMNQFFLINGMYLTGSSYWNMSLALEPGDYEKDEEGIETMRKLGLNMAWLIKKLESKN